MGGGSSGGRTIPRRDAVVNPPGMDAGSPPRIEGRVSARRTAHAAVVAITAGAALLVLLDFIVAPLTGHFSGSFDDFGPILAAGHAANAGLDPYAPFLAQAPTQATSNLPFDFLPLVAVLARPLAALPHAVAVTLWLWGIVGCTIAASVITARTVLPRRGRAPPSASRLPSSSLPPSTTSGTGR